MTTPQSSSTGGKKRGLCLLSLGNYNIARPRLVANLDV